MLDFREIEGAHHVVSESGIGSSTTSHSTEGVEHARAKEAHE